MCLRRRENGNAEWSELGVGKRRPRPSRREGNEMRVKSIVGGDAGFFGI